MLYPLNELTKDINGMETRYSDMRTKSNRIATFNDSLIYNSGFRSRTLGTNFTRAEFDSTIEHNKMEKKQTIIELETLRVDRTKLGRNFNIFNGIDHLLELLFAITGGLTIFYWIKLRN